MRIGLFGGTFDPPHLGHMQIAQAALEQVPLDEVLWIPANRNPLKVGPQTDRRKRLHMCRLAIEGHERMAVSDIETTRRGESYLVETLEEIRMVLPGEYWFVLGMDALAQFPTWKEPERVLELCRLAVFARPGTDLETTLSRLGPEARERVDVVSSPVRAVSSSNIRKAVASGEDVSHVLAPAVYDYIKRNGLYRD